MNEINLIEVLFDDLLFQTHRGNLSHNQLDKGVRFEQFEQIKEWKSKYGFKFNVYGNDHLINGKAHFHFDNHGQNIFCKIDFNGNILENNGSEIPKKVLDDLKYFLSKDSNKTRIKDLWNVKNPSLVI